MEFIPPLQPAQLIKRYKRFLADVRLPNGEITTLHCANTGAMTGCATPGDTVWYSFSSSKTRKYPCSWELTQTANDHWIGVNTLRANQLVEELIEHRKIPSLSHFTHWQREVRFGDEKSRIDFVLSNKDGEQCYLEVKSVTLLENSSGYFPDTITLRGQKHLRELMSIVKQGKRAVLFFAVLHTGITQVRAAQHLDPAYAHLLYEAIELGVEVIAYRAQVTHQQLTLVDPIPFTK
ncbi:DNA/RNA nuclease SfsA [Rosenbergiella australiborealis]|uniref:Sugar fermentation stimulation protein homolog n=1 Tax=Rosenbergiella australiborealis TaxID=1544696 RepID=A0ABS5T1K7_9GAMM|nr:DNA/RNA nuclease SfsA [Rosenbergiella australiborealis]MBT0726229.1 DNA/RNA nuclease SfsA [Rosenbergiella australiborealis]